MKFLRQFSVMLTFAALLLAACSGAEPNPVAVEPASLQDEGQAQVDQGEPVAEEPEALPPPVVVEGDEGAVSDQPAAEGDAVAEPDAAPQQVAASCNQPWPADTFGYGIQAHAVVGDPAYTMDVVNNALGMDWVKVQLEWPLVQPGVDDRQWFFYDGVVEQANQQGLCLMFSVVGAPAWTRAAGNEIGPPDDYNIYAAFLTEMLNRYPGQIHAVEAWNEQNLDREWQTPNGVSPEDYVQFLAIAYDAIKAVDPNVIVISGALAPTGDGDWVRWADDFAWMDRALAAGMLNYADCVGAHHNGYNIPPDVPFDQTGSLPEAQTAIFRGPFDNPHHSWSFRTTLDTYAAKIQAVDPNMKLCVTEFGWASSEGYDAYPEGFEFAQDNTLEEQSTYLVQAYNQMRESGDVWLTFAFNFDFGNKGNGPTDDPVPYSIVDGAGAPRPAFGALAAMEKIP